jgi:tetratricopeptide (TPR) repeat protein
MMKTLITIPFLLFMLLPNTTVAQEEYDDLLVLYVDGDYEKCIAKAERCTDRDKTRRDPLPYLYLSMCYFEISKLDSYTSQREWRRADRDALRYAKRFRKKDKHLEFFHEYEDYWEELNTMAMETGLMYLEMGDDSKARRRFDAMVDYYPENPGAWQMLALAQQKLNLYRDAKESMERFHVAYTAVANIDDLPRDQQQLLRTSLIYYAESMDDQGLRDSAQVVLNLGEEAFMENVEFRSLHEQLN